MARIPVRREPTGKPEPSSLVPPDPISVTAPPPPPPSSAPPPPPSSDDEGITRIGVPIDKDGAIVLDRMREATRAEFRKALNHPATIKALGVTAGAKSGTTLPTYFGPLAVAAIEFVEQMTIAAVTKAPRDVIERVTAFSDEQKKMIEPPLMACLNKYGGSWLDDYQDEIGLAIALVTITSQNIAAVREAMAKTVPATVVA